MQDMPTLGKSSRRGPARSLIVAVIVVAAAGVFWWRHRAHPAAPPPPPPTVAVDSPSPTPSPAPPAPSPIEDVLAGTGMKCLHAVVEGPLETSIVRQVGAEVGRPLTQVVVRALVWWLSVPGDLRKGDTLDALYSGAGEELHLDAIRFQSERLGKTVRACRYQAPHDKFARFYTVEH